jgi:copper homeostasis protein
MKLEIVVFNKKMAKQAEKAGATQVDVLIEPNKGGLTPCLVTVEEIVSSVSIPVYVVVRHADTIHPNDIYVSHMIEYIKGVKELKVAGVVFGSLDQENNINKKQLNKLVRAASGMDKVFNRSIDETTNYLMSIKKLKKIGFTTILTAGNTKKAIDGIHALNDAKKIFPDILIGGGVGLDNAEKIIKSTGISSLHIGSDV